MLRVTFWHAPQYFQFYFRDPEAHYHASLEVAKELESMGVAILPGAVLIRTLSEYSEVPITVEYDDTELAMPDIATWDQIMECPIESMRGKLVLEGCTGASPFGELDLPAGKYRIRIYFGGQLTGKRDGSAEDYYLLQIWPSSDRSVKVLKGATPWPRPKQEWEA